MEEGVGSVERSPPKKKKLLLRPQTYVLPSYDFFFLSGYMISPRLCGKKIT